MSEEIAQLKQLQADINGAFDDLLKSSQESLNNPRVISDAKERLGTMAQKTLATLMGPAFSIITLSSQPLGYAAVRIAIDLKLFEIINKPTSLDDIVRETDADPVLLQRILRAISSLGYLKQTAVTKWEPTSLGRSLNVPALRDWLIAHFDQRMVICGAFPNWLRKRGYKTTGAIDDNVTTETLGAPIWTWYENNLKDNAVFDSAMSIQESFPRGMKPPYPFSRDTDGLRMDSDAVALVDIGGGFGQAIKKLREEYPNLKGRFILQDLPKTINQINVAKAMTQGFEPMVHDFFNPQVIKGAKYYHLRRVLHDWNDGPSIKILEATRSAMKDTPDYSRLLIHESVLPDVGCGYIEAMLDIMMMQLVDGMERTESQWHELLRKTGFKIVKIWRADIGTAAVIEAVIA